ncbi:MAG: hypothetical protein JJU02_03240 [Cryomorphaceae bacterium]|nr:hypothetical protein [Cryomorphaceae bacterium]
MNFHRLSMQRYSPVFLFFFIFVGMSLSFAQNPGSFEKRFYPSQPPGKIALAKLSYESFEILYEQPNLILSAPYDTIDLLWFDGEFEYQRYLKSIAPGNYLKLNLNFEYLELQFFVKPYLTAHLINHESDGYVQFTNLFGKINTQLEPKINCWWCRPRYKAAFSGYQLSGFSGNKTLVLKGDSIHQKWRVSRSKPLDAYGDGYGGGSGSRASNNHGYIITSQPVYRHLDTLKMKAYLLNEFNKPLKDAVRVELREFRNRFHYGSEKLIFRKTLAPTREGLFLLEEVLGDSLKLDKEYKICIFYRANNGDMVNPKRWSNTFSIKDYQLDDFSMKLEALESVVYPGEDVTAIVQLLDGTQQPMPGARVIFNGQFSVISNPKIKKPYSVSLHIATDTIYTDHNGFARFTISKEKLDHPFQFSVNISAEALLPNGEMKKSSTHIQQKPNKNPLILERRTDGFYAFLADSSSGSALLIRKYKDTEIRDSISLPVALPPDPMVLNYIILYKGFIRNFSNDIHGPVIGVVQEYQSDGIHVKLSNPFGYPFKGVIRYKKQKIEFSHSGDTAFLLPMGIKEIAYLDLYYFHKGKLERATHNLQFKERLLNISSNFPEKTYPGMEHHAEVQVKNYLHEPVSDVDVSVVSFTDQFETRNIPDLPYTGKIFGAFSSRYLYSLREVSKTKSTNIPLNEHWVRRFGKRTDLYYDLLLNKKRIYRLIPNGDSNVAEIAVYPIAGNAFEKPIYISMNGEIVYYYRANQPFSFYTQSELNSITVRMKNGRYYNFHDIPAVKGYKTVFSFFAIPSHKREPLTDVEMKRLEKHYFQFTQDNVLVEVLDYKVNNNIYFRQGYGSNNGIFGPLLHSHSKKVNVYNPYREMMPFTLVPGKNHQLNFDERTILISENNVVKKDLHSAYSFRFDLDEFCCEKFDTSEFFVHPLEPVIQSLIYNNREKRSLFAGGTGASAQFVVSENDLFSDIRHPDHIQYYVLMPKGKEGYGTPFFFSNPNIMNNIQPGEYRFYGITFTKDIAWFWKSEGKVEDGMRTYFPMEFVESKASFENIPIFDTLPIGENLLKMEVNHDVVEYSKIELPKDNLVKVFGSVKEQNGQSVPFATVIAKDLDENILKAVDCDVNGDYALYLPEDLAISLEVSFLGFRTFRIEGLEISREPIRQDFYLNEEAEMLSEVEVISYSSPLITKDVKTTVAPQEINQMAIRDVVNIAAQTAGVFVPDSRPSFIDGVKVRGSLRLPQGSIQTEEIFTGGVPAQYGDAGGGLVQFEKAENEVTLDMASSGLRSNFSDYAIWEVNHLSNDSGYVRFTHTWPDDITTWETHILAMNPKLFTGQTTVKTKAFKPIQARLFTPRFAIHGDRISLTGQLQNQTGQRYPGSIRWSDTPGDTLEETTELLRVMDRTHRLEAPEHEDSLSVFFGVKLENGYEDGETRKLPLYPLGALKHEGMGFVAWDDTTFQIGFESGEMVIHVDSGPGKILQDEVYYLSNYVHSCNEQMASRLLGLALYNEKLKSENLSTKKNEREIQKIVKLLNKNQLGNGTWAWYGMGRSDMRMTKHIAEQLLYVEQKGIAIGDALNEVKSNIEDWIEGARNRTDSLELALLMARLDLPFHYEAILIHTRDTLVYHTMLRAMIAEWRGIESQKVNIMELSKKTIYGNIYWEEKVNTYMRNPFGNQQLNFMAFELLQKMNAPKEQILGTLGYLLEKRRGRYYYNTVYSSTFSRLLANDFYKQRKRGENPSLTVSPDARVYRELPVTWKGYAHPDMTANLKTGGDMLFVNWYNERWESHPKNDGANPGFSIVRTFKQSDSPPDSVFVQGREIFMEVEVTVSKEANYMMMELPIPAGCGYKNKSQHVPYATHTEQFRDRVVAYFDHLPTGTFTIRVPLQTRFSGKYYANPVRLGSMYFKHLEYFDDGVLVEILDKP